MNCFIETGGGGVRYLVVQSERRRPGQNAVSPCIPVKLEWHERSFKVSLTHSPVTAGPDPEADLSISRLGGIQPRRSGVRPGRGMQRQSAGNRRILTFKP